MKAPTYDRPVAAKLIVRLANGEEWEATPLDYERFGLVDGSAAYMVFNRHVEETLQAAGLLDDRQDITDSRLNPLRYIAELAFTCPELLTHPETREANDEIVAIEKTLRGHEEPAS